MVPRTPGRKKTSTHCHDLAGADSSARHDIAGAEPGEANLWDSMDLYSSSGKCLVHTRN